MFTRIVNHMASRVVGRVGLQPWVMAIWWYVKSLHVSSGKGGGGSNVDGINGRGTVVARRT